VDDENCFPPLLVKTELKEFGAESGNSVGQGRNKLKISIPLLLQLVCLVCSELYYLAKPDRRSEKIK
jgi:hypothetical protein